MFYVFTPVCLFVCQQDVFKIINWLAEAGGPTVLGPEISGLDFGDDANLGFAP